MPIIKKLAPHEAQKIAAGEVVERPANIIKELLENSIDAGATSITLSVEDSGKKRIQVSDNGCGMDSEDAELCFEKHATSKISSVDDLETITTFGFRGEALASIAAVSNVTLITKTNHSKEAIKLQLSNGVVQGKELVTANTGTTIEVHDLFYNIPARKKFLKTKETEWRHIQELVHAFSMSNLNIHFRLINEGKVVLNCPPVSTLSDRFAQLFTHSKSTHLLSAQIQDTNNNSISGVLSDHQHQEYNRNNIFFFVNNRWVKNYQLSSALIKGYSNVLQPGRYPIACIMLTVDPHLVDINIHPRKEEVRFLHPRIIEQLLTNTVKQTLEANLSSKLNKPVTFTNAPQMEQWRSFTPSDSFVPFNFDALYEKPLNTQVSTTVGTAPVKKEFPTATPVTPFIQPVEQATISPDLLNEHAVLIGQLHNTYLLLETAQGLFLVDQHAAHERILYELFRERFKELPTITLLFPQTIKLSLQEMALVEPHLGIFHQNSISIERFSADQLVVHATPVHLKDVALDELIKQVIGWIKEYNFIEKEDFFKKINEKLHAQMACKAAVKAGDILSNEKMTQLVADLQRTPNKLTCPHGRPTGWLLSSYEIEKKFKRKL